MKIIGLTGGIASGKSTVARLLASFGVSVIDADLLAREAVEPGTPALQAIAAHWPGAIGPDGTLSRQALADVVFADPTQREALEAIVVPGIVDGFRERAGALAAQGQRFCVLEAATLFEERLERLVDGVLVVTAPQEEQVRRFVQRTGLSEREARARMAAQLPQEEKVRRSRWVLDNGGPAHDLELRVRELWERIQTEA